MLKGKFVTLRIIEKSDIEIIRKWRNLPEVYTYFANRDFITENQQENWFNNRATSKEELNLIIIENESFKKIGLCHLEKIDYRNRNCSWGFYIADNDNNNRAYILLEAIYLLLNYVFDYLNLQKINCNALASNTNVIKFDKALGFEIEGILKSQIYFDGRYDDMIYLSLFRDKWNDVIRKRLFSMFSF